MSAERPLSSRERLERACPPIGGSRSIGRRLTASLLAVAGVAIAGWLSWDLLAAVLRRGTPDAEIDVRRWTHRTLYRFGFDLPGTPDLGDFQGRLKRQGLTTGAPVFIRIFKREFELELWLQKAGRFELFATYPICRFSGTLGPKLRTGDKQAPEGFYTVAADQLNPQSRWHRSFNLGFPNTFDRAHGRSGSFLMVHGGCGSVGCYAMTNPVIDEIWTLVEAALKAGQPRFQVQVLPFRLTEANLASAAGHSSVDFWRQLKAGSDLFEASGVPPRAHVCRGQYVFEPGAKTTDGSALVDSHCGPVKGARN